MHTRRRSPVRQKRNYIYVQFRGYFFHPDTMEVNGTLLVELTTLKNDILLFNSNVFLPTR